MKPARLPAAVAAVALVSAAGPAAADPAGAKTGLFVKVPAPLTSPAVTAIKKQVDDARNRGDRRPAVVVFDFTPGDKPAASADFGTCYGLASYIAGLHDVQTVGFVHQPASGHLLLPALTCQDLVMGPAGQLAGGDRLTATEAAGYAELVGGRRPAHLAVARKLFDPAVELRRGRKGGADFYVDQRAAADGVAVTDTAPPAAAPDGRPAALTAAQAADLGLTRATAADRREVADRYGLSPAAVRDDPLAGAAPVAFRFALRGRVDRGAHEAVRRVAEKVVRDGGNLLVLVVDDCGGGDVVAARDLADDLRRLHAEAGLRTVAFVPNRAPDTAAVVALGCSEIVMSRRADAAPDAGQDAPAEATFGDCEQLLARRRTDADAWAASLRELADAQGYPPLLAEAMVRPDLELVRVRAKTDRTRTRLVAAADPDAPKADWESVGVVKPKGQFLRLTASQAEELGLTRFTADTRDVGPVLERYGVDPSRVRDATPAWLDRFAAALKDPAVTAVLVIVAFGGMILEMKVPGTAVPGIVSAVCFVLVFWAHTQFSGQLAVLAGLLFLLGLVLLLVEVFVTPGFGAAGLSGILLMLSSLALVTVEQAPGLNDDPALWVAFAAKVAQYLFGMAAGMAAALVVARYLPHVPYANRLMLPAPDDAPGAAAEAALPGAAQAAALLGAVGTAATVLRPAGAVRFGDEYVDVVTDGGYVPAGARVQVIEVEGTRIVVREV